MSFASVIAQIFLLDLVFSINSVITAVGMAGDVAVMIVAVAIAILIMMVPAEIISTFGAAPSDGQNAGTELPDTEPVGRAGRRREAVGAGHLHSPRLKRAVERAMHEE